MQSNADMRTHGIEDGSNLHGDTGSYLGKVLEWLKTDQSDICGAVVNIYHVYPEMKRMTTQIKGR